MLECQEQDHNQQEIILICVNVDCQIRRSCCLDCVIKHNSHKKDLKSIQQITKWKKSTTQSYEIYQQKINQIVEIISQAQKYLSNMGQDLEKSFDEIVNDEFEKQVCNLLKIQQLSSSFNSLTSNLETLMEPISSMFSIVEASSKDKWVKAQPSLHITNDKQQQTFGQEQQIQKEQQIDFENQGLKQQKQLKTLRNLDLIRKENDLDIYQFPLIYKQQIGCIEEYKTIILIGTQNSQKQNLINLFVNYYYDVEFSDGYRFEIDDKIDISKDKQNDEYEEMKVYYIRPSNGQSGLRIIYTPDYNDDLIYEDQQIFNRIFNGISNSTQLNQNILIGFVIPQQVQIGTFFMLESILSKFPNILINNILFLFPDCTDDYPKQKQILQSKTEIIHGIPSPISQMIPKINNVWYLKFNTNVLYLENQNQQNQFLWQMGKNSFQLLLNDYLSNKINCNILQEMKCKYDEFLKVLDFSVFAQKMKLMFLDLYKRDNFQIESQQKFENFQQQLLEFINLQSVPYMNNGCLYYQYHLEFGHFKESVEKIMKDLNDFIEQNSKKFEQFQSLINNKKLYNQDFEEFYQNFKNFGNFMKQQYHSQQLYFKFNSILVSINHSQWRYYENLISKEQSSTKEGWKERVQLLTKKSKCFQYFDDINKAPNLKQLIKQWSDQYFSEKQCTCIQYKQISWNWSINYENIQTPFVELFKNYEKITITKRISEDCEKNFDDLILKFMQDIFN
ncbi:unnamed protein product [Paramecium octaurelia]|uniref:Uncharacterized protein n=1 Tax=Paramecium octaurelia TaxID=43137 RepID=A0A8S1VNZ7_PAROT|nr:unnamed protein product [Paramecium octaurelia]